MLVIPVDVPGVTTPPELTDAIAGLVLDQVPPDMASVKVIVLAWHHGALPTIAAGAMALTVTVFIELQVP